jgi:hypothetical protein
MTLQTGKNRYDWRRVLISGAASGAMAASLLTGFGVSTAFAEPGESCTGDDCAKTDPAGTTAEGDTPPAMTADEALAIIARDYDLGEGGGQLSTLIHDVMTLRAQGFKPSNANKKAITEALDDRPNQAPLIQALKETLSYQRKMQALQQNAVTGQQPGFTLGQTPLPPGVPPDPGNPNNTGIGVIPGTGITQPVG